MSKAPTHVDPEAERAVAQLMALYLDQQEMNLFLSLRKAPAERDYLLICGKLQMIESVRGQIPQLVKQLYSEDDDDT